ncbi:MAG TPA: pitrilysin family protein [Pseudobdellovibrionaceae bacterium]|nr:pitrilysin family protein [Pseudobdellovibrionaceae bacterium]
MRLHSVIMTMAFLCFGPARAQGPASLKIDLPVEKYTLENGLTVLLLEDHRVPMISYHTWYKVGSKDEAVGVTGSAHMLEHMMFQGAKKYSGKDLHRIMDENGISWNAFTTYDYTGFYMNLPSSKLELIMDVEFDRMSSLNLDQKNLLSEREVVKEERRFRVDNNPQGLLWELTMSSFFKKSPYRWPVIGWMKDIEKFDIETLRKYYNQYYVPNNAVLVIAGDFNSSKVKSMIRKYYGSLSSKPLPPKTDASEAMRTSPSFARLKKDVQSYSFNLAFPGVKEGDPDMYALDLAGTILGSGSSSRLNRDLVYRRQIALSASSGHFSLQDAGVFLASVTMKPGLGTETALSTVEREVAKLRTTKVSADELKKAKTILMKSYVDGLSTMDAKARALAANEIVTGSYKTMLDNLEKYEKVTEDDILRVAKKYLARTNASLVILEPRNATATSAVVPASAAPAPQGGAQ